jgi:hypothetical protein
MRRLANEQLVANGAKNRSQHMPRQMFIDTDLRTDLVEPQIGRVQRPVKDFEAGGCLSFASFDCERLALGTLSTVFWLGTG